MSFIPKPQEIYKHFKGNLYQIITLAKDSEDEKLMVVYQALYGDYAVYVRPLDMFVSKVDREKYPDAVQEYRFERQMAGGIAQSAQTQQEMIFTQSVEETEEVFDATEEEPALDPLVLEFLDADSHEQRLNILAALHHRITDQMITTMAIVCDVEVPDGDVEERYNQLKNCLIMLDRFEIKRK